MGMVGEACLPGGAYCPRTPDCTLCSGVRVCWSGRSGSSFVCGFVGLDCGLRVASGPRVKLAGCKSA